MAPLLLLLLLAAQKGDAAPRHLQGVAHARANLASYISDADYPAQAIRAGEHGVVGFRLDITREGTIGNCTVTSSSGSNLLDTATCRIMTERARFTPARDRRGRPTTDWVTARVRWVLPEDEPNGPTFLELSNLVTPADYPPEARARHEQGRVGVVLEVGRDGHVTACHVYMSSGSAALDAQTCTILKARAHLPVTLNVESQPVTTASGAMVTWTLPAS